MIIKIINILLCNRYPIYQKGNPQLRVFLPNFWMKLVKPQFQEVVPNQIEFHVSMEMTKHDVKNYLQKIYNVPALDVRTRIKMGRFRRCPDGGYIVKDDDIKVAYAIMVAKSSSLNSTIN